MTWFAACSGKRGRSPKFSDAAIQFCLTLKNLFGLALRQATGLVESVLKLSGLSWPTPDFSTLSRRQRTLNVQIPYTRSHAGLHLLVDSTGIKFLGEGEWKCKKHGAEYRRQWRAPWPCLAACPPDTSLDAHTVNGFSHLIQGIAHEVKISPELRSKLPQQLALTTLPCVSCCSCLACFGLWAGRLLPRSPASYQLCLPA